MILNHIRWLQAKNILDYGCHTGHLSFEMALRFSYATIYSVDNFVGTPGDELMEQTFEKKSLREQFYDNMKEVEPEFKGKIVVMTDKEFHEASDKGELPIFDFGFIDSGHREEDIWEFESISKNIKRGGVLGGHDMSTHEVFKGVRMGIDTIIHDYTWLRKRYTWFLKKKYSINNSKG
jgi:hypothetical protein